jgi:hypothetical protein
MRFVVIRRTATAIRGRDQLSMMTRIYNVSSVRALTTIL